MSEEKRIAASETILSSDKALNRTAFLKLIAKNAAMVGALSALPAVADRFLVPAAWASGSSCSTTGESDSSGMSDNYAFSGIEAAPTYTGTETNCMPWDGHAFYYTACLSDVNAGPYVLCCGTICNDPGVG